ncbi:MAG: CpaF family protein [Pseudomonadota bacterium]
MTDIKQHLQQQLREHLDQRDPTIDNLSEQELREHASNYLSACVEYQQQHRLIIAEVVNEAIGLGPLEPLLGDDSISEIMVNRFDKIFIEKAGCLQNAGVKFSSEQALRRAIDRIVLPLGRHVDEASPMVDARLSDGSRVNAVITPLALAGSCVTIRKFSAKPLSLNALIESGSLSAAAAEFLILAVKCRQNIIVSGGTGTGKTTLLNTLSGQIPASERVITIEDAAELQLEHENLISLEARPKNQEGQGAVGIRELVINALRMRPDRLVVGECRGAEALDMLQAMNTGHAGSLSTVHANTARDALRRLEVMVLMGGIELPVVAIRQQVASAVDIIVQIARLSDGRRVVMSINEVTGLDGDTLQVASLYERSRSAQQLESCQTLCQFAQQQTDEIQTKLMNCLVS